MKHKDHTERLTRIFVITSGLAILGAVTALDFATGSELSFSIFYLIPVLLVTWYAGRTAGFIISIVAAFVTWFISDIETFTYYSNVLIPYWNAFVRLAFFLVTSHLLASLRTAMAQQKSLALTDSLTGAENVRAFCELAENELERVRRNNKPISVVYIDLDNFKNINDTLGHIAGNEVLQTTVETMKNNLRKVDVLARLGGDEFAILLPETDETGATTSMERIQMKLNEAMQSGGWPTTFSIGIAAFITPPATVEDMICKADLIMYEVKNNGKNMIHSKTF
jgi:diguanylate cyclase (GGDEF)-like protein